MIEYDNKCLNSLGHGFKGREELKDKSLRVWHYLFEISIELSKTYGGYGTQFGQILEDFYDRMSKRSEHWFKQKGMPSVMKFLDMPACDLHVCYMPGDFVKFYDKENGVVMGFIREIKYFVSDYTVSVQTLDGREVCLKAYNIVPAKIPAGLSAIIAQARREGAQESCVNREKCPFKDEYKDPVPPCQKEEDDD